MATYIDTTQLTSEDLKNIFSNSFRFGWYKNTSGEFYSFNDPAVPSLPIASDTSDPTDDIIMTVYWAHDVWYNSTYWDTASGSISAMRYGAKLIPPNNDTHICLVRYKSAPTEKWNGKYTTDGWLIVSNTYGADGVIIEGKSPSQLIYQPLVHRYNIVNDYRNSEHISAIPDANRSFSNSTTRYLQYLNRNDLITASTLRGMDSEDAGHLLAIYDGLEHPLIGIDTCFDNQSATREIINILPSQSINWAGGRQIVQINKKPEWMPTFDISQVGEIVNFLKTGDDSGAIDPFDSNNPDKVVIDNYKTNYRIFVSPWEGDKRKTKFTAIAYNTQLIENFDNLSKDYSMSVYEADGQGNMPLLQSTPMEKYPTVGWYVKIDNVYTDCFVFGEKGEYSEVEHDTPIYVYWEYKPDSAVNCRVTDVMQGLEHFSKSNIVDGYRYTAQNGTYVEILFRTPTVDDLDGGYSPKEDHEDDKSGSDSDFSGASGLRTFSISNADFETINKKLWSTDWTTVFKSSSIDPVKCVISCKGIPFTADSVSSAEVVIANMDTGLNKNYVKSVKSFNVGSVLMPHYNDDFTDITLTHIRCYLPYIGWVELPASECISRVAYSKVGIEARPKRLKFKYLVDFVDGSVRCVVSVNDTERWFFDGNCSVDIPVTSDNHTQAVSNALRSGLQTGLSIATAVAGAYTSNAGAVAGGVIGAMQNAPNIFPTYSYTATANGSGYINASMNTHIMIVIERPNTIKSTDYAKRVGVPCGLSLNLGSLHGYTVCKEVDVTGIDATPDELSMIKSLLESGVYL